MYLFPGKQDLSAGITELRFGIKEVLSETEKLLRGMKKIFSGITELFSDIEEVLFGESTPLPEITGYFPKKIYLSPDMSVLLSK
mgnify:CR=1 FL=1